MEDDQKFLLVSQLHWEDDIIWNVDDATPALPRNRSCAEEWARLLSSGALERSTAGTNYQSQNEQDAPSADDADAENENFINSVLPPENPNLVYGNWEDKIIWDADTWSDFDPILPTYDAADENFHLNVPLHESFEELNRDSPPAETSTIASDNNGTVSSVTVKKPLDPYNISNDEFYKYENSTNPCIVDTDADTAILPKQEYQHAPPVLEFHELLFPPQLFSYFGKKMYHRPSVRARLKPDRMYRVEGVRQFKKLMELRRKKRNLERRKYTKEGSQMVKAPFETILELSGRDSNIILVEYCEEFPALLSQVGMHSEIKNYTRSKERMDNKSKMRYGAPEVASHSTFIGSVGDKDVLQALENKMYRCPIYEHRIGFDFLVIRSGTDLFVREIDGMFTAGQQCPFYVVPSPTSKVHTAFQKNFLEATIYSLFDESPDNPKEICMSDIVRLFGNVPEAAARNVLNTIAVQQRIASKLRTIWKIKPGFVLPQRSEYIKILPPEAFCANYSTACSELRLQEAGYTAKDLVSRVSPGKSQDVAENERNLTDEIKCAPWNTTQAFVSAQKGMCLLDTKGVADYADPTGCGEAFPYVQIPKFKSTSDSKLVINGKEVDLKKMLKKDAKQRLHDLGVPLNDYKRLSRWELINLLRVWTNEKRKSARRQKIKNVSPVNPFSKEAHQRRYKEALQGVFDLQNRLLSSDDVITSEESDDDDDEYSDGKEETLSDIEDMGKQIENMISGDKASKEIDRFEMESEERRRKSLLKLLLNAKKEDTLSKEIVKSSRVLKIRRTISNPGGGPRTFIEVVKNQKVIDLYLKMRESGNLPKFGPQKGTKRKGDVMHSKEKLLQNKSAKRGRFSD